MTVAPELFDVEHARNALAMVEALLLYKGMKTLDPHVRCLVALAPFIRHISQDLQYRGSYVNDADSDDRASARGFNYHQACSISQQRRSVMLHRARSGCGQWDSSCAPSSSWPMRRKMVCSCVEAPLLIARRAARICME